MPPRRLGCPKQPRNWIRADHVGCAKLQPVSGKSEPLYSYEHSARINAPAAVVWGLVTAMDRYGEWSSENTGGYWRKKPDGSVGTGQVGDEFVGVNRRGDVEWKGLVEIVEREEEKSFAFITGGSALNFVFWRYQLEADGDATVLTEQWALRNLSPIMIENGDTEVAQRVANAKESIGATLAAMTKAAEAAAS